MKGVFWCVLLAFTALPGMGAKEEVGPVEDLMREHGVLRRVLLVYEEAGRRIEEGRACPVQALADAAGMVRDFVEDYHERLEEEAIFPRLEKAGKLRETVQILLRQHEAGRRLTQEILRLSREESLKDAANRRLLAADLQEFARMYRPHAAREDTVVFPAWREIVSAKEWAAMGERFEEEEARRFGEKGFEKMVARVAGIEKQFGIADLSLFTPGK